MVLGGERSAVQNPFIRYAVEAGWKYFSRNDASLQRGGENGLILRDIFIPQIQKLNPGMVDHVKAEEILKRLERVPPTIEGNLQTLEYLRGLRTVYVEMEKRERNLLLIHAKPEVNLYHVTDEFSYTNGTNGTHRIRADVVLFINGVPVVIVETKAATKLEGIAEALDQLRRYHQEGPEFLALLQVYSLTHLIHFYYGATWNTSRKDLFNWKEESAGQDFETMVKAFVSPRRVLRVLSDYILFTRKNDELSKVILRPHQMRAVERAIYRAREPEKRRALIWHTQGSGKTFTMIIIAQKLIEDPALEHPTVLMLVDRNELEQQLFGNLAACGFGNVEVAKSKRHLRDLLRSDQRGLIVSMIHKFDDIPADLSLRKNIFVLADEAHRTTGGNLGNCLMGALPNATYFGFTGTPIDRTAHGKGTFKVFGCDDEKGYLDKYSIAESIADKTTVPLNYTLAPNELRVDREVLEKEFLELAEVQGVSDPEELNKVLEKAVTLKNMLKNKGRVAKVAEYVARHFQDYVDPMGYKAFLVGVDREACVFLKEELDKHLPSEWSRVVISPAHNDLEHLVRHYIPEDEEKKLRKAFIRADSLPKILIVTEKLLTGYDAPVLYCMYLDKPMRDHVLLQAIARVNRPYEDESGRPKTAGFVLDFVGIFEKLERALAFDSDDVKEVISELGLLKERFTELIDRARAEFLPLIAGQSPDKAAESALEHFRDELVREEFYQFYKEISSLFEIISPDAFLRKYLDEYDQLTRLYKLLRSAYEQGISIDKELTRKTATLVQEHTQSGAITDSLEIYRIDENTLEELAKKSHSPTVSIFNLLKSISQFVQENAGVAPYLISIGERAEAIVKAFQERQATTQATLEQCKDLIRECNEAEKARAEKKISPQAFAVYWLLTRHKVGEAEKAAQRMGDTLAAHPHWQSNERQERMVRRELYKTLADVGVRDIEPLAKEIFKIVGRASR